VSKDRTHLRRKFRTGRAVGLDAVPPGAGAVSLEAMTEPAKSARLGTTSGAMLVMASMIGTGVFTTTGYLVRDLGSLTAVLLAWVVGGIVALCGALAYGELVAALPNNGGEYWLLTRIYHPALGFVAGWVSLVVGFSAPMAASAVAFGEYLHNVFPGLEPRVAAALLVLGLGVLHAVRLTWGSRVQNAATVLDALLIASFIAGGIALAEPRAIWRPDQPALGTALTSPAFAIGLIYVSFSYSGWNAAVYVAGELKSPERTLPKALLIGTGLTALLYVGLNFVFLVSAPPEALSGVIDVGHVAAAHLFGPSAALATSALVAVGLFTTVSALMMTGPRVYEAMGRDYPRLRLLSGRGSGGDRGPVAAIVLQTVLALIMLLSASFDALLTYMGFTLSLFAALTIAGVFVLRVREPGLPRPYRTWGHPVTTILALALDGWMLVHALSQRPGSTLAGLATLGTGVLLYFWMRSESPERAGTT
jgi:basic amino acid/polyamine antiporter, APA family